MITFTANTRQATVTDKELLTTGSAGIEVQFVLSADYTGKNCMAVFRMGDDGIKKDVVLDNTLQCVIPHECLTEEGEVLFIGVYATNGQGTIIIPTVWGAAGVIKPGTEPNTPANAQPTPSVWEQILGIANDANQTAGVALTEADRALAAAENAEAMCENVVAQAEQARDQAVSAAGTATSAADSANASMLSAQEDAISASMNAGRANAYQSDAYDYRDGAAGFAVGKVYDPVHAEWDDVDDTSPYWHNNAEWYATQAESWAIGGTDTREDENTDNAKYYAELAELSVETTADWEQVSFITDTITAWGLTYTKLSSTQVQIYGTSTNTATRYCTFLNGRDQEFTSSNSPLKTFPAGHYKITFSWSGHITSRTVYRTTNTPSSGNTTITSGEEFDADAPFCVYLNYSSGLNFGTENDPTVFTIKVERFADKDKNVLYSTQNNTDRTAEVYAMLSSYGECALSDGEFYIAALAMPNNSHLHGTGNRTRIILGSGDTCIGARPGCIVSDLEIVGPATETPSSAGSKNGISFATSGFKNLVIENCYIHGFNNCGIRLQDVGGTVDSGAKIVNCRIEYCYYGIGILKSSEYNFITNCNINFNYYGVLSRGGNNKISNSGLDGNVINCQIDVDEGSNAGHGSIVGCSFNHSNANQNDGYSLIIKDTGRMAVSGCQFYYGKLRLENTNGNMITGCGFGNATGIEIVGGQCSVFNGCVFSNTTESPITRTSNTTTVFRDCFVRGGSVYGDITESTLPSGGSAGQFLKKYSSTEQDYNWAVPDANEVTWNQTVYVPVYENTAAYTVPIDASAAATTDWPYYTSIDVSSGTAVLHGKTTTSVSDMPSTTYDVFLDVPCKVEKSTSGSYVLLKYYAFDYAMSAPATYTNGTVAKELSDINTALGTKVDKVTGKGLSTEDYTTAEKTKLSGIAAGAEVNVQSDWNQTSSSADDYIKNKPANLVQDANYTHITIDSTLANSGQAADAKAAGDAISAVTVDADAAKKNKADIIVSSASGAIASFPDGARYLPVKELEVAVEPVQDLHGYDNPWPAGGGKNICDVIVSNDWDTGSVSNGVFTSNALTATGNMNGARLVFNHTFDLAANTEYFISFDAKLVSGTLTSINAARLITGSSTTISGTNVTMPSLTSSYQRCVCKCTPEENTTVGKIYIQLNTPTNAVIMITNVMVSTSSDSTFAPYSNICPISGWTEANITRTGKNMLDANMSYSAYPGLSVAITDAELEGVASKQYAITGTNTGWGWRVLASGIRDLLKPDSDYCISYLQTGTVLDLAAIANLGNSHSLIQSRTTTTTSLGGGVTRVTHVVHTVASTNSAWDYTDQLLVLYSANAVAGTAGTFVITKPQLTLGVTPTEIVEEYLGTTIEVTFPSEAGTVYGGTLTKNSDGTGTLVVDRANVDLSTLTWTLSSVDRWLTTGLRTEIKVPPSADSVSGAISDKFKEYTNNYLYNNTSVIGFSIHQDGYVLIRSGDTTNSPTGQLVYFLKTPVSYTLTAEELGAVLTTLLGTNNIWADTGDVSVDYRADTKLYIEKLTKPTEDDMIANTNIASGKFFMVGNNLYLSTASIANGAAIVPGTNCTALSLADALNNINS